MKYSGRVIFSGQVTGIALVSPQSISFFGGVDPDTGIIEAAGVKFGADTCCVVAPIRGCITAMATDCAKACYYASSKNKFRTQLLSFDDVVLQSLEREP